MASKFKNKTVCNVCKGKRLRQEALYVYVGGKNIGELANMSIADLVIFLKNMELSVYERTIADKILIEIINRLDCLNDLGLGYLTLNRNSNTLSGGESQRINLSTSIGSSLVGSMYILDEPSIGLHSRDSQKLINVLKRLRDLGNTVIVVEHDEDIIHAADYVIDIGRYAGDLGGDLIFQGDIKEFKNSDSITAQYLYRREKKLKDNYRYTKDYIDIKGAKHNNLKNIDVRIPIGCLTSISGVSGSGKSTLIRDILYPELNRRINGIGERVGSHSGIFYDRKLISNVEYISQNPIGRSSRSIPITYTKAYEDIRILFASMKDAKFKNLKPGYFSFNTDGGRCDNCKGEGYITIDMQFMADIKVVCEECKGMRFKREVLEVCFHGKNINDILNMSVDQAIDFFDKHNERKISSKIQTLSDVGLGYLSLGQSSSTLSGGEAQRLKLASFLDKGNKDTHTLFLFDEPTTGLHFYDIEILLSAFDKLISNGNTIVVIEHNMDVLRNSDYIIDLGKEGGNEGGYLLFQGFPNDLRAHSESYTAKFICKFK